MNKLLAFMFFCFFSVLIGFFIYLQGPDRSMKQNELTGKGMMDETSLHIPQNVEKSIDLSETPMIFNSADKQYQPISKNGVIYFSDYSIGLKQYYVNNKESKTLIPSKVDSEGNSISFASDVSPDGNYLVYSHQFWDGTPTELTLVDIESGNKVKIANITGGKVYLSLSYWNPEEKYFYYSLGSSQVNHHFPSPEQVEFYRYNIDSQENTFIGLASKFTDTYHASIFAESKDNSRFYVKTIQHGEGNVESLWSVNSSTFEQTKIWEAGKNYYYPVHETNTKDGLVLQTYDGTDNHFLILDLATGLVKTFEDYTLVSGLDSSPVMISKSTSKQLEWEFDKINAVNLPDSIALESGSEFIDVLNLKTSTLSRHPLLKPEGARLVWSVE